MQAQHGFTADAVPVAAMLLVRLVGPSLENAPDRAMQDMSMLAYLDLVAAGTQGLPPYLGNLELRELNGLCHWPAYFSKWARRAFGLVLRERSRPCMLTTTTISLLRYL